MIKILEFTCFRWTHKLARLIQNNDPGQGRESGGGIFDCSQRDAGNIF